MNYSIKKFSEKNAPRAVFGMRFFAILLSFFFLISNILAIKVYAAAGVPKIINFQGRLMNSSGALLGGSGGTNYCYKFAIYDASTAGTKLWPTGTPTTMTILTTNGVFDASVGGAGGDTLDYDFQTSDTTFMDVQVSAIGAGSCTSGDESFETLDPRPQIVSAAYAINSGTVQGFTPAQSATNNQIPVLTSGALILSHATTAGIKATSTNPLTFQSGVTGDVQFFSSSNKITSGGALTIAGLLTSTGLTATTGDVAITSGNLTLGGGTTRISNAGVGTFITGTVIGSQTFTTNNIADSGALTISSGSGTALTLNSGSTGAINIGTDASAETINIGNTGAAVKSILIGNNSQANTITIGDASATSVSITDNNWSIGTGGAAAFTSISSSGAIAANGGITFDASTDTLGAFTLAGTLDASTNILTNIGNAGTDFIASTGALTLAGTLTLSNNTLVCTACIDVTGLGANSVDDSELVDALTYTGALGVTPSGTNNVTFTLDGNSGLRSTSAVTSDATFVSNDFTMLATGAGATGTLVLLAARNLDGSNAGTPDTLIYSANSDADETVTNGLFIENTAAGTLTNAIQIAETAGTITDGILITGTLGNILNSASIDITGAGAITGATGVSSTTGTFSSTLAANGGITFDASTDTLGAFTLAGTLDASTNILTNIGNAGTDFIASTGALTLAGVLTANGGITVATGQQIGASNFGVEFAESDTNATCAAGNFNIYADLSENKLKKCNNGTVSDLDTGGSGIGDGDYGDITVSGTGTVLDIDIFSATDGLSATTSSGSGLESLASGLGLLQGCTDGEILKWTESSDLWGCAADAGAGSSPFGTSAGLITKTSASDRLSLIYGDAGDVQLDITNIANSIVPTADVMQILLSGGSGITTDNVDGLYINIEGANGTSTDVSALHLDFDPITGSSDDTFTGLLIDGITGTAAVENGLTIGAGWDSDISFADTTPTMTIADNGTLILSDGSSTTNDIFQIGTATSRGNALIYGDLTIKGGNIARALTGVIDVFVYDTSGDTDGGDWRNSLLALQTSWATETKDDGAGDSCVIASDDRCGGSVFPRKAIIATTASGLYIFDAADNSLWMKFTQSGTFALGADSSNDPSGVAAQNGVVVVGTNGTSATGMYAFDFKQDVMYRYNTTNRTQADVKIGSRNSTATYATNAETGFLIIDNKVNDVSLNLQTASSENLGGTLLAPIDSQAGPSRGVTIIAAATDTGVSVINMGTRKVINYSDVTNDDYNQVYMTRRGRMYATNETQGQLEEWRSVDTVSTTQANGTPTRKYDELLAGGTPITLAGAVPTISTSPSALAVIERGSSAKESAAAGQIESGDIVFVGTNQGLAEVHTSGGTLATSSWSKITTKDSATPYMIGAVRAAYLFDEASGATAAASAVGAAGTTSNPMDSANATAPTFGGSGIRGGAINFNNNSYLCSDANADGTCDADTDFNAGTLSFTISLWFKHSVTAASDTLFERCYTPATPTVTVGCVWAGMTSTGAIKFATDVTTTWTYETTYDDSAVTTALFNDNQWHHAVFTNTDTDLCIYIDGRQLNCDTALSANTTVDASQVLTIGGVCSGANCTTGTNFWDGSIDEFVWSSNGGTTGDGLTAMSVNKLFLDGRTHMVRPQATVTDATTFSSTTIGDSGESYIPDSFTGLVVEITGGTGSGQTRTVVSNTATTFTVYPVWTTTPDTTTDYRVSPSKLYGSTNTVTTVAVDAPTQLNKVRKIYVGTSDGADGGGVSVFTNAGAGGLKTEIYSTDSGVSSDDFGTAWSGTNSDNIVAISAYSDTVAFATGTGIRTERKDLSVKQLQADMLVALDDVRNNMVASGLFGATQDVLGLGQGADLAEYYYSNAPLEAGDVVAIQPDQPAGIGKSESRYQKNLLGVVSTAPGLTLGPVAENAYPIALSGRIPVKITNENGAIHAGDLLTSSSRPGYAMRATQAGAILGRVINEPEVMTSCDAKLPDIVESVGDGPGVVGEQNDGEENNKNENSVPDINVSGPRCGYAMLFAGLGESLGKNVEILAKEFHDTQNGQVTIEGITTAIDTQSSIMNFLRASRDDLLMRNVTPESIFTDRIAAGLEILTPTLYVDNILSTSDRGVVFGSPIEFSLPPIFNKDTAGFAIIKNGARKVEVIFENAYISQPITNVSISLEDIVIPATEVEPETIQALSDADAQAFLDQGITYIITNKTSKGFTIRINKNAPRDVRFSWTALAIKDPSVFEGILGGLTISQSAEQNQNTDPQVDENSNDDVIVISEPINEEVIGDSVESVVSESESIDNQENIENSSQEVTTQEELILP